MNAIRRESSPRRKAFVVVLGIYLVLLLASNAVRWSKPQPEVPADRLSTSLPVFDGEGRELADQSQRVTWLQWGADSNPKSDASETSSTPKIQEGPPTPVILLHGSPGNASNFRRLGPLLGSERPIYAIDLPGFGYSSRRVPSYSIEAHAMSVLAWMDQQQIETAHLLGFSMGGGVALEAWQAEPHRVASITMMASIGVQELELLGDYHLNHLLHGLQLVGLEGLRLLTPNFGTLDGMLDYSYERNFFDSDQRPLREILRQYDRPMLILHGELDPLVPKEAAIEHHRLVPQSRLVMRPDSHFFVFRDAETVARTIDEFLDGVEDGTAPTREQASPERVAAAQQPFDVDSLPNWSGPALLVVLLLIAGATLISEDLTLIGTGLIVAQGRIAYLPAAGAAFFGIVLGDMLLFWAGRALGRRIVRKRPFSWWISPQAIRESSKWLRRRGAIVILVTRVLPGARLPTNVAAGLLRTSAPRFLLYFIVAGVFWTFPVVWLCARLGERILPQLDQWRWRLLAGLLVLGGLMWLVRKLLIPLATWRGRRHLIGAWRHRVRWEFWPSFLIYAPLLPYFLWLALKHRGLTVFTAANPGIPAGGFVGESKAQILAALPERVVPDWIPIPAETPDFGPRERLQLLQDFYQQHDLSWPLVVKPDVGERGSGVLIARSWEEVTELLEMQTRALIGQRFVEGVEYSVFWVKRPSESKGSIFSVTAKKRPTVVGDGRRKLYDLMLADDRAVALAKVYLEERPDAKDTVPERGEVVTLSEVGAHSRGTIFEEGSHLISDELHAAISAIATEFRPGPSQSDPQDTGFDFGRFDIITESEESFRKGKRLSVLELNGVTSESTNMYDSRYSIFQGWRILRKQWDLCYSIGAERKARGTRPAGLGQLLRDWRRART